MTTVIAASALGTVAHADFVQFDGEYSVNSQGNNVVKMYAEFDDAQNVLLNLFDVTIDGDFIHSDVQIGAGGTWNPTASLDIPGFSDSENDSYVTAGYGVGAEAALNGTALDPNFLNGNGGLGSTIPTDAGWYNGNPGFNVTGTRILIGQFVYADGLDFAFTGKIGYKESDASSEVGFGEGTWAVPSPGALALLGLSALVARRRRG